MSKYVVAVFPDESKAYEGQRAFNALDRDGSLTLYGIAVIGKNADGTASVKDEQDEGLIGTAVGMLTGGLIGALAGPAGIAFGAASGGLLGSVADLNNLGVGADFLDIVGSRMEAGSAAVVAEVEEYWTAPLDTRVEDLGGTVFRRTRADFEDEQFAQEVQAWNDEMDELDAEIQQSSDETKAKLQAKKDAVRKQLEDAREKGSKKISQLQDEQHAKVEKLKKQVVDANAEAKAKIEKRIEEVKAGYQARIAKLGEAGGLIKEALAA
jgi:uncharacterized membrane protein